MTTSNHGSGAACVATLFAHGLVQDNDQVERIDIVGGKKVLAKIRSGSGRSCWYRLADGVAPELLEPTADSRLPLSEWLARQWEPPGDERAHLVAWRPGRRMVATDGTRYFKGFRRGKESAHGSRLNSLRRAVDARGGYAFRLQQPLRIDSRLSAIVFQKLNGVHPEIRADSVACFSAIGAALDRFQSLKAVDGLAVFSRQDEFDLLQRFRQKMLQLDLELPRGWERTYLRAGALIDEAAGGESAVLTHRDLHDGQILWDGKRPGLLDYDLLCLADSALDPANLCAHLALRSLQRGGRGLSDVATFAREDELACRDAFLVQLRSRGAGWRRRFDWYETTSFLRLALVYAMRPRQDYLSDALTALAERVLDRRVHA